MIESLLTYQLFLLVLSGHVFASILKSIVGTYAPRARGQNWFKHLVMPISLVVLTMVLAAFVTCPPTITLLGEKLLLGAILGLTQSQSWRIVKKNVPQLAKLDSTLESTINSSLRPPPDDHK